MRAETFPPLVAFQGERGAYGEGAVAALLGPDARAVPCPTFESLFASVAEGRADRALAPLENSLAGDVGPALDLLAESELGIIGEVVVRISHCLIGCRGATLEGVREVASHPVALAQCGRFFAAREGVRLVEADDTAASARRVVERGDPARAAVASLGAARLYGGVVLAEGLEDDPENYTRFALLAPRAAGEEPDAAGELDREDGGAGDKLSLVVTLAHRAGALAAALEPFARRGMNLLRCASRPARGRAWHYRFFLDYDIHGAGGRWRPALRELRGRAEALRLLGRYPAAARHITQGTVKGAHGS